jgi:hypothetical protein
MATVKAGATARRYAAAILLPAVPPMPPMLRSSFTPILAAALLLASCSAHAQSGSRLVALINAFPEYALERAGYHAAQVEVIFTRGAADAAGVMDLIRQPYCRVLLNAAYSDIGASRQGDEWTIVLARPLLPVTLPEPGVAGREILAAVNAARAVPRTCGERAFCAAPPVAWTMRWVRRRWRTPARTAAKREPAPRAPATAGA